MIRAAILGAAGMLALAGVASAEMHEVRMLNSGEAGKMIFEPAFVRIEPGDSVKFIAATRGHNAETIGGMIPEGAEGFEGRINEEIEVTLTEEGLYGVQCKPHYAMGMVMTIAVGDVDAAPEDFLGGRIPKRAKERFEAQLGNL